MELRRYKESDTKQLCDIYYNTIHNINKCDYTEEELNVWAPPNCNTEESYAKDTKRWNRINPFIVSDNGVCIGFAELEEKGHINCFFVHHEHQGRGVGAMLINACVDEAKRLGYKKIFAEVSITARPFFLHNSFQSIGPMLCEMGGMQIKFYNMQKDII